MDRRWREICDEYMRCTAYSESEWGLWDERPAYDRANRPETYLSFPDAPVRIPLGEPVWPSSEPGFWQVLRRRRSLRNFLPDALTLNQLNLLLWGTQGITGDMGDYQLRTAPSSGATYPTETYLLVNAVEGLRPGVYHLSVKDWVLEGLSFHEDMRDLGCAAALGQEAARMSAVNFVWTAVIERCRAKYHERTYRYLWWDAAHIAQNLLLSATAAEVGACVMGAWFDDQLNELCGIDGVEHTTVLFATVGKVQGEDWRADRRPAPKRNPPGAVKSG